MIPSIKHSNTHSLTGIHSNSCIFLNQWPTFNVIAIVIVLSIQVHCNYWCSRLFIYSSWTISKTKIHSLLYILICNAVICCWFLCRLREMTLLNWRKTWQSSCNSWHPLEEIDFNIIILYIIRLLLMCGCLYYSDCWSLLELCVRNQE